MKLVFSVNGIWARLLPYSEDTAVGFALISTNENRRLDNYNITR